MDGFAARRTLAACAIAMLAMLAIAGATTATAYAWERSTPTVTPFGPKGLDNPRGLTFGPEGRLYVAEAGNGGSECVPPTPPFTEEICFGFTSGISTVSPWGAQRVLSGLASIGEGKQGVASVGVDGVQFDNDGGLFAVEAESSDKVPSAPNPHLSDATIEKAKAELGRLIHLRPEGWWHPSGQYETVADVGHFDFQWSGEHKELVPEQFPDANPYAVYAAPYERFVIDAGSNTLDEVTQSGQVSVIAFFPNPPKSSDSVPTCIARGPEGAFYVGQLTGVGNGPGAANIWRVAQGGKPEVWASGLTGITGCGFGPEGRFYAVEFSTLGWETFKEGTGALVLVPPHSTAPIPIISNTPGHTDSPLSLPGGFASHDGAIYVSNWSIAPTSLGLGQVVRISLGSQYGHSQYGH